jgi:hypothetical protein
MHRQLALKEFRETIAIGAVGFVCAILLIGNLMELEVDLTGLRIISRHVTAPGPWLSIPFVDPWLDQGLALIGIPLALVLGFRQTLGESFRGLWLFLLHRPLRWSAIVSTKLIVGAVVLLAALVVPVLVFAAWAATPGTHASPFAWWMTGHTWRLCFALTPMYLAAFLCGTRPARWYLSRLLPLAPAGLMLLFVYVTSWWPVTGWIVTATTDAVYLAAILRAIRERDFG